MKRRHVVRALFAALVFSLPAARGDEPKPAPRPPEKQAAKQPPRKAKLSAEDEALVKELALVENVDLLKDLDLFEGKEEEKTAKDTPQRQQ